MLTSKIPEAERLFRLLATYQNMKSMLDARATTPVTFRISTGKNQYVTADDDEGIALIETAINTIITQLEAAVEEL